MERLPGQLASLTDAESQTTSYTYDDAGAKLTEQYPDHTGGSVGASTYGIVTFVNDAAGRVMRKQDQKGDTVTFNYDLAGRLTSRIYRLAANSPSGTIADTDSFTYDKAGRMLTAVSGRYANTVTYTYDKHVNTNLPVKQSGTHRRCRVLQVNRCGMGWIKGRADNTSWLLFSCRHSSASLVDR